MRLHLFLVFSAWRFECRCRWWIWRGWGRWRGGGGRRAGRWRGRGRSCEFTSPTDVILIISHPLSLSSCSRTHMQNTGRDSWTGRRGWWWWGRGGRGGWRGIISSSFLLSSSWCLFFLDSCNYYNLCIHILALASSVHSLIHSNFNTPKHICFFLFVLFCFFLLVVGW